MEGVIRTVAGYTGGTRADPTYRSLGDHTEAVRVVYDPATVSYDELLEVFWGAHDPRSRSWSRQYRNALFYHSDDQERLAAASRNRVAERLGGGVATAVEPAGRFYPAEDYHQKYLLKARPELRAELEAYYRDPEALTGSTAAARINGYLGGHGTAAQFDREAESLGLSPAALGRLRRSVGFAPR